MREEIAGPKDPLLLPALPAGMTVRNAFVPGDGRVIVDVNVDPAWARAAGSGEELACVGAIVNALLQNIAQTNRVKILVNGSTVETLAGHVDLSAPLPAMKDVLGGAVETPSGSAAPAAPPGATPSGTTTPAPPPPTAPAPPPRTSR